MLSPRFLLCALALPCLAVASRPTWAQQAVADALNHRYETTVTSCGPDVPAIQCSGVLLRVTSHYMPSDKSHRLNIVSFSYVRADTRISGLYSGSNTNAGIIVPTDPVEGMLPIQVRCAFPTDAFSEFRLDDGCGSSAKVPLPVTPELIAHSQPCAAQGIDSAERWIEHFGAPISYPGKGCGFDMTPSGFLLSIAARSHLPDYERHEMRWNELVVTPWTDAQTLPIEAFFYATDSQWGDEGGDEKPPGHGLPWTKDIVRDMQRRFFAETGRAVPIVRMNLEQPAGAPAFAFDTTDQAINSPDW